MSMNYFSILNLFQEVGPYSVIHSVKFLSVSWVYVNTSVGFVCFNMSRNILSKSSIRFSVMITREGRELNKELELICFKLSMDTR